MITLYDAKQFIAPVLDMYTNDVRVVTRINEAIDRLVNRASYKGTIRRIRIGSRTGYVTMPRCVGQVLRAKISNMGTDSDCECDPVFQHANVYSRWYEFIEGGPTNLNDSGAYDLVDQGQVATAFDICGSGKIMVTAEVQEDVGCFILIRGEDQYGKDVRFDSQPGEKVAIKFATPAVSSTVFSRITSVVKTATKGYIYLHQWNATDSRPERSIATYAPDEFNPFYRRYKLASTIRCEHAIVDCIVKLKYEPVVYDSDPLMIQNLGALKMMCMSLKAYDSLDVNNGTLYEMRAIGLADEQSVTDNPDSNEIDFQMDAFAPGEIEGAV